MAEEIPILMPMVAKLDDVARQRIKTWIASTGVTQTALSERIGKNQAWTSRYLSGDFDADLDTLQKFAQLFGHSLNALLDTPADPGEAAVIEAYRALPPRARALVLPLFREMTRPPRGRRRTRR